MFSDYFLLALKNLANRRLRSWLTMIGIIIGITAVVSLIGLGEGLREFVSGQFGEMGTDMLTVTATGGFGPPGTAVVTPLTKDNADRISDIQGVDDSVGRLVRPTELEYNDIVAYGYAASIPYDDKRKLVEDALNIEAESGRLLRDSDKDKVVVGNSLSTQNPFDEDITPDSTIEINKDSFDVVGILEKKGSFVIDSLIIMQEDDMRETLEIEDEVYDIIAVKIQPNGDMDNVKSRIEDYLRRERDVDKGEEDFSVETPESALEQVNNTLFAVQLFVYIIAGISILVGGLGIMNTMFTSVMERTKQIGIMKSIGATKNIIFSLFFIESGLLGSVGGLAGALLGSGVSMGLARLAQQFLNNDMITAQISPTLFLGSVLGAFALGSIFGIIPALNAAKLTPVDALRHKK